ncbi:MAG: hypothetical protein ACE5JO_14495 [Candidatus Binatia bacterium]
MEVVVISVIGLASAMFVLWPLMRRGVGLKEVPVRSRNGGRENLLREKETAIGALKEIEFDYVSGKLSFDDYSRLNSSYENRVVKLLKELDGHDTEDPLSQVVEEIIAERKNKMKAGQVCPQCYRSAPVGSNYCPDCGTGINRPGTDEGK